MSLNGTISQRLDNKQDRFFPSATALGATATITSSAFRAGAVGGRVEVALIADSAITNAADITIDVTASATEGGSYTSVQNVVIGAGTIASGGEFFTYTPDTTVPHYMKVAITTAEDLSAKTITGTLHYTA